VLAQHPELIIQTGGVEHAKDYAEYAEKQYKTDKLGIWHDYQLDRARLIFLAGDNVGIKSNEPLNVEGRFAAVAPERQVVRSIAPKIKVPTLEQIMQIARKFTPEINQEALKQELGTLYD